MRAAAFLVAGLLAGCGRVADYATVVGANRLHERGLYQDAAAAYLSVGHGGFGPTIDYDLANVYARLGEIEAAALLYARAREGDDAALRCDASFNEGYALYEKGRYEESWRAFRLAITQARGTRGIDPAFLRDAGRNLELAWRAWQKRALAPPQTIAPSARGGEARDETELRMLRRLETGRWRPGMNAPSSAGPDDY